MPENKEIAANEQLQAERQFGLEQLLTSAGGKKMGGGVYNFAAPPVNKSAEIAADRDRIARTRMQQRGAEMARALEPALNANVRGPMDRDPPMNFAEGNFESTNPNAEAGFFQDFTPATWAPPGYTEAGHRSPEDMRNPQTRLKTAQYEKDYYADKFRHRA